MARSRRPGFPAAIAHGAINLGSIWRTGEKPNGGKIGDWISQEARDLPGQLVYEAIFLAKITSAPRDEAEPLMTGGNPEMAL